MFLCKDLPSMTVFSEDFTSNFLPFQFTISTFGVSEAFHLFQVNHNLCDTFSSLLDVCGLFWWIPHSVYNWEDGYDAIRSSSIRLVFLYLSLCYCLLTSWVSDTHTRIWTMLGLKLLTSLLLSYHAYANWPVNLTLQIMISAIYLVQIHFFTC